MVPRQMRDTFRPVLPRFTYFISAIVLLLAACTSAPTPTPPAQAAPPPPAELSTIVIPIRASLEPLLPLIEKQVPSDFTKLDAYELDPSQRFGLRYSVYRDPIVLNMQNAGLHTSARVHYALEPGIKHQPRGALIVRTADVLIVNTHLDELSDGTFVRQEQVRTIIREVGDDASPLIVAGDLNATPDAIEVRLLNEFGMDDIGAPAGETTTMDTPQKRIDYVWGKGVVGSQAHTVLRTDASDHRGLVVNLTVTKR